MKPTTSKDPAKALKIEVGSLYFYEGNPNRILICTKVTANFITGVLIHSPFPNNLGAIAEYDINKVRLFNGRLTLEQYFLSHTRSKYYR